MLISKASMIEKFSLTSNWEDRYRFIIQLSRQLPAFSEEQKQQAIEIKGCENRVWLSYRLQAGKWHFFADSEGRIIKGLIAIILIEINSLTAKKIVQSDLLAIFEQLKISQQLSPSRVTGLKAIIDKIKQICSDAQP